MKESANTLMFGYLVEDYVRSSHGSYLVFYGAFSQIVERVLKNPEVTQLLPWKMTPDRPIDSLNINNINEEREPK